MSKIWIIVVSCLWIVALGCENKPKAQPQETTATAQQTSAATTASDKAPGATAAAGDEAKSGDSVEVPQAGKEFKPPIAKDKLPAGAWFCDMGTVHYARMEKGDGSCPLCHMKLKQASAAPAEADKAHGEDGHQH